MTARAQGRGPSGLLSSAPSLTDSPPDGSAGGGWEFHSLSELLDAFMRREGLTLQAMADRTGLAVATIASLRDGSRGKRPYPETLAKLAPAMGTTPQALERAVDTSRSRRERQLMAVFWRLTAADQALVEAIVARLATPYGG